MRYVCAVKLQIARSRASLNHISGLVLVVSIIVVAGVGGVFFLMLDCM